MTHTSLQQLHVLVTRPLPQALSLQQALEAEKAHVSLLPTLVIADVNDMSAAKYAIEHLPIYDMAIFTSANAVHKILPLLHSTWPIWPTSVQLATIGDATARVLESAGYVVPLKPRDTFTSEALLALPTFQHVAQQKIIIFTGVGGRATLAHTLQQRGAEVTEAAVYQRKAPGPLKFDWKNSTVDIIIITSGEGLQNLLQGFDAAGQAWLKQTPILVVSQRLAKLAKQWQMQTIYTAADPSPAAIIHALKEYVHVSKC